MTNYEAIKLIDGFFSVYKGGQISRETLNECISRETLIEYKEVAYKALEKQIPKKPDLIGDGYDDNGNLIYDTWICPCCETQYELDYDDYKFCPKCGQAIGWNEVEKQQ